LLHRIPVHISLVLIVFLVVNTLLGQDEEPAPLPPGSAFMEREFSPPFLKPGKIFAIDKAQHFMGSLISTVFFFKIFEDPLQISADQSKIYACGITLSLGISKELYDRSHPDNRFSWKDLIADLAGITCGLIIANQP